MTFKLTKLCQELTQSKSEFASVNSGIRGVIWSGVPWSTPDGRKISTQKCGSLEYSGYVTTIPEVFKDRNLEKRRIPLKQGSFYVHGVPWPTSDSLRTHSGSGTGSWVRSPLSLVDATKNIGVCCSVIGARPLVHYLRLGSRNSQNIKCTRGRDNSCNKGKVKTLLASSLFYSWSRATQSNGMSRAQERVSKTRLRPESSGFLELTHPTDLVYLSW